MKKTEIAALSETERRNTAQEGTAQEQAEHQNRTLGAESQLGRCRKGSLCVSLNVCISLSLSLSLTLSLTLSLSLFVSTHESDNQRIGRRGREGGGGGMERERDREGKRNRERLGERARQCAFMFNFLSFAL